MFSRGTVWIVAVPFEFQNALFKREKDVHLLTFLANAPLAISQLYLTSSSHPYSAIEEITEAGIKLFWSLFRCDLIYLTKWKKNDGLIQKGRTDIDV